MGSQQKSFTVVRSCCGASSKSLRGFSEHVPQMLIPFAWLVSVCETRCSSYVGQGLTGGCTVRHSPRCLCAECARSRCYARAAAFFRDVVWKRAHSKRAG